MVVKWTKKTGRSVLKNVVILGLASLLTDISSEMIYPLLPFFLAVSLGATPAVIGVIEGVAESLASLLKVFSGYISDRLAARKPIAILGYSLSAVAKILFFLASSWTWVLWGRVGDRFGKGVRTAPRDALIADSAPEDQRGRAFGLHRAMDTLGAAAGVMAAFFLVEKYQGDFRPVFMASLLPAALGVLVLLAVREVRRETGFSGRAPLNLRWSALDPGLKKFLLVVFLFALGNSSNQFLLLRAHQLGYSTSGALLLYLAFNLVHSLSAYPAGVLSDRMGRKNLLVAGYLFYGLVYLAMAYVPGGGWVWLVFALYGLYSGLTEGVEKALVSDLAPAGQRATLLGLHATLVGIGLLPSSMIAGLLWDSFGPRSAFLFGGCTGILAAAGMVAVLQGLSVKSAPSPDR